MEMMNEYRFHGLSSPTNCVKNIKRVVGMGSLHYVSVLFYVVSCIGEYVGKLEWIIGACCKLHGG
jgi:hypothetical protein